MARLLNIVDSSEMLLPARCLVGRSRVCQLRLRSIEASGEHVIVRWRDGLWEVQDLSSRNGTYCDGKILRAGQRAPLTRGARLGFGRPDGFVLTGDEAPAPFAVELISQRAVEPEDGLMALPGATGPEVVLLYRYDSWWKEDADGIARISDGDIVTTSAGRWRLYLPEELTPTGHSEGTPPTLAMTTLSLSRIPNDGIRLVIKRAATRIDLGVRFSASSAATGAASTSIFTASAGISRRRASSTPRR